MAGIKKYIKKGAKKVEKMTFGSKGFKGRYGIGKGKGGFNFAQVAKDLAMVKSRLNVEKKSVDTDVFTGDIGQCNINAEGAGYFDITPSITQGTAENQRIGNSLKMTGLHLPIDVIGQQYCLSGRRLRFTVLKVRTADNQVDGFEALAKVWDVNPLTGLRDFNAPRAYRNAKNDGISIVYSKVRYMSPPSVDAGSAGADLAERPRTNHVINLKLQDTLRYNFNADTFPGGFKYFLIIQADAGNRGSTGSTLDVPVTTLESGVQIRMYSRWWYVDN